MKKRIKIALCIVLAVTMLCLPLTVSAAEIQAGDARTAIGADLTDEQIAQVYGMFGIERGSVKELTVTNSEERTYLDGYVDESVIGHNSISCVYIEILADGEGLQIETDNLTWCTQEMIVNALVTSGIDNAKIIVAAPISVSGTAALTGIYKAYEDITGNAIDESVKLVSTQELVITSELAAEIGSYDAVEIVNEIKLILDETVKMTDEELRNAIVDIAAEYGVTITNSQMQQLITLCRSLESMSSEALREQVEYVQNTVKKISEAQEKVTAVKQVVTNVVEFVSDLFTKILDFFGIAQSDATAQ